MNSTLYGTTEPDADDDRLPSILSADGIRGDPARSAAARELARWDSTMSADAIVSWTNRHVAQGARLQDNMRRLVGRAGGSDSLGALGTFTGSTPSSSYGTEGRSSLKTNMERLLDRQRRH